MSILSELGENDDLGECSRTFILENEGHTLGNALHSIISRYPDVEFCGYTVPHPTENKIHFRIQANKNVKAIDVLRRGFEDLEKVCDHIMKCFENEMSNFLSKGNSGVPSGSGDAY